MNNKHTQSEQNGDSNKGLSTTQKFADERLTEKAQEVLYRCQDIDATGVEITVYDGVLNLSGFVEDQSAISFSEECLKNIKGLKSIQNELVVRARDKSKLS